MYRGRLKAAILNKAGKEGKAELRTQGRFIGGIKFYGDKWITFNEADVNMDAVNKFIDLGYFEIEPITVQDSRPPIEQQDVMAQAEDEIAEDAEIEAEVDAIFDNRCQGIKGDGEQCTRNAQKDSQFCKTHKEK